MFDAQSVATILLSLRVIAVLLLAAVVSKQIHYLRTTQTKYPAVRITVMILTATLLIGQVIPIILDTVVAFGSIYPGRNPAPNSLAVSYSMNNAIKDVIIGALLVFLYYRPQKDL